MALPYSVKRWIPFGFFVFLIIGFSFYLFFNQQKSDYRPQTENPSVIYYEACSHCHGKDGRSDNLLYPDLDSKKLSRVRVRDVIQKGDLFMPAFEHIRGDTLQKLVDFIINGQYKQNR